MSCKYLIKFTSLAVVWTLFCVRAYAKPIPELIENFEVQRLQSLVQNTLSGTALTCPNEGRLEAVALDTDHNENSNQLTETQIKLERIKLFNRLKNLQNKFSESYLQNIAQAKYNQEYCQENPNEVEKEICDQANSLMAEHIINLQQLESFQKEIRESNQQISKSNFIDDPFLKLIEAPKSISNLENSLNKHLRRVKSFVEASVKTFKSEFIEDDKRRIFDFHVRALGFLQKSPIQLDEQANLNQRLLSRASRLLGKSGNNTLLNENEVEGEISDLAAKIRAKYFRNAYISAGNNTDSSEEHTHSVMTLRTEVIGQPYLKDEPIEEPIEHIDVTDTSDPWDYRDLDRVGVGRGGTSNAVNWPNGNGNGTPGGPGGQCDAVLDTPNINGTPYVVTTKVPCNKVTEEIKEEMFSGFMEEFGKELKNEISNLAPDLPNSFVNSIFPENMSPLEADNFLNSLDSRLEFVLDRSESPLDIEKIKKTALNKANKNSKNRVRVKPNAKSDGKYKFISKDKNFLDKAKGIQDKLHNVDKSKLNDQQKDAYDLAQSMLQEADQSSFMGESTEADSALDLAKSFADIALSVAPGISVAKDIFELITGKNMVTGEPLSDLDLAAATLGPLTGGLSKVFGKSAKLKKFLKSVKNKFWRKKGPKAAADATSNKPIALLVDEAEIIKRKAVDVYKLKPDSQQIRWLAKLDDISQRHYFKKLRFKKHFTGKTPTVVSPRVNVKQDLQLIRQGQAVRDGDKYIVNGRTYKFKPSRDNPHDASFYPEEGPGLYKLSPQQYKALSILVETNGDGGDKLMNALKYDFKWADFIEAQKIYLMER